ncbi:hypothetical protein BJX70DRAFT_238930 [Aspergillus crustosus]
MLLVSYCCSCGASERLREAAVGSAIDQMYPETTYCTSLARDLGAMGGYYYSSDSFFVAELSILFLLLPSFLLSRSPH